MKGCSPADVRVYGDETCSVALLHDGPGACGEMVPVARDLSGTCSVARLSGRVFH